MEKQYLESFDISIKTRVGHCVKMAVNRLQMANEQASLPILRVKTIMKSSPEVENISNESIHLVARATELFIQSLAQESFMYGSSDNELQYRDIAEIVDRDQRYEFLRELIPLKITVGEYKDLLRKKIINLS